jgi:DNA-binding NarL/FixJ family response regulator
VLRLVARGRSNQQIASTLFLGESTVKSTSPTCSPSSASTNRAKAVVLAY